MTFFLKRGKGEGRGGEEAVLEIALGECIRHIYLYGHAMMVPGVGWQLSFEDWF